MTLNSVRAVLCLATVLGLSFTAPAADPTNAADTIALKTQGPRTSGPVSVSLQNEINAAVDRGRAWLLASQNTDGSWGGATNAAGLAEATALAALALLHDATAEQRAAALRGCQWLASKSSPKIQAVPAAWRALALRVALPLDASISNAVSAAVAAAAAPGQATAPMRLMLLQELGTNSCGPISWAMATDDLAGMCLCAMPPPTGSVIPPAGTNSLLQQVAARWPRLADSFRNGHVGLRRTGAMWVIARYINRAGGGTLADAQGNVLDWRNTLALELVSSQTIAPAGRGGFWKSFSNPGDALQPDPIEDTAFALLALDEL